MSVDSEKICCTGCDFETLDVRRPIRIIYRLNNGKEIDAWRSKGWCYECNNYRDIEESIDSEILRSKLVEKEQERREALSRVDELSKGFFSAILNIVEKRKLREAIGRFGKQILKLSDSLAIASNRKAGPRCLTCWSDKTAPVTFDDDGLAHNFLHRCGGMLKKIYGNDEMRFHFRLTTYVLSKEGELLDER